MKVSKPSTADSGHCLLAGHKNLNKPSRSVIIFMSIFFVSVPKYFGVAEKCYDIEQDNIRKTLDICLSTKIDVSRNVEGLSRKVWF